MYLRITAQFDCDVCGICILLSEEILFFGIRIMMTSDKMATRWEIHNFLVGVAFGSRTNGVFDLYNERIFFQLLNNFSKLVFNYDQLKLRGKI
jgi:hypothetical protein